MIKTLDFFSRRNLTFGKDLFASKAIAYKLEVALRGFDLQMFANLEHKVLLPRLLMTFDIYNENSRFFYNI